MDSELVVKRQNRPTQAPGGQDFYLSPDVIQEEDKITTADPKKSEICTVPEAGDSLTRAASNNGKLVGKRDDSAKSRQVHSAKAECSSSFSSSDLGEGNLGRLDKTKPPSDADSKPLSKDKSLDSSVFFRVQLGTRKPGGQVKRFREAWIMFSFRIHWLHRSEAPRRFSDFTNKKSLAPVKLPETALWSDVTEAVYCLDDAEYGKALVVKGRLGIGRFRNCIIAHTLAESSGLFRELVVAPDQNQKEIADEWMKILRFQIAPWQVLTRRLVQLKKSASNDGDLIEFGKRLAKVSNPANLEAAFKKALPAPALRRSDDYMSALKSFSEFSLTVTPTLLPFYAIGVYYGYFRLIPLTHEAYRGMVVFPRLRNTVMRLELELSKCMQVILNPSVEIDHFHLENVFKVRQETLSILRGIERQLMSSFAGKIIFAEMLKQYERSVESLEQKVVVVSLLKELTISNSKSTPRESKTEGRVVIQFEPLETAAVISLSKIKSAAISRPILEYEGLPLNVHETKRLYRFNLWRPVCAVTAQHGILKVWDQNVYKFVLAHFRELEFGYPAQWVKCKLTGALVTGAQELPGEELTRLLSRNSRFHHWFYVAVLRKLIKGNSSSARTNWFPSTAQDDVNGIELSSDARTTIADLIPFLGKAVWTDETKLKMSFEMQNYHQILTGTRVGELSEPNCYLELEWVHCEQRSSWPLDTVFRVEKHLKVGPGL